MEPVPLTQSTPVPALPYGLKGVRGALLLELKRAQGFTAKELAVRLGLSLNAVRHHLKELEAASLIEFERRQHGVGAPAFVYRLSPLGGTLFPRRYESTLTELLDHVIEREGRAAAVAVLEARYDALTRRLQEELAGSGPADRMTAVARFLSEDGYMAEGSASSQTGTLVEHNCAIQVVAERFPEICAAEAKFLSAVLGAEVERREHILSGCSACEYRVRFSTLEAVGEAEGPPQIPTSRESV